ncbi:hypothetical protein ACEPAH_1595 [Sanghuangporus vaninii]
MAPIGVLLRTVFEAILEVFLQCVAGYVLAKRGILDKKTQKQLNRLNVSLFTPALLFSKVAFSLTREKMRELWIIPIFFAILTVVSMITAYILGIVFRLKKSQRNFAIAAAMFMNSNSLPIALMQSLVVTVPNLKWDDDDSKSAMLGRALSYLVLSSTLGMVLRWSYGVHLLSQADTEGTEEESHGQGEDRYRDNPETLPLLIDVGDDALTVATSHDHHDRPPSIVFHGVEDERSPSKRQNLHDEVRFHEHVQVHQIPPRVFYSFPNTPTRSAVDLADASNNTSSSTSSSTLAIPFEGTVPLRDESESESDGDEPLLLPPTTHLQRPLSAPPTARIKRALRHTRRRLWKLLRGINEFLTVPLWAALMSFIVVIIPPVQHSLDSHMQPIKGALNAAGNCSIPITLVVLGAYFYQPPAEKKPEEESGHTNGDAQTEENGTAQQNVSRRSDRSSFVGSIRSTMLRLSRRDHWEDKKDAKSNNFPGETRTVWIAIISRMIITPIILLPLMAIGASYDNPKLFDDPVFVVSNVLLISSPPALTLAQITQAASGDAFERLISKTIFWSYCVVTPPATIIYVVVGLLLAKL